MNTPIAFNQNHAAIAYAELQVTSNFSFLRGASHPGELVERAVQLGHRAIGIADRNSLAGVVRAHAAAKKSGMKLLVGARLNTTEIDGTGHSLICYPQDRAAYGRLCKLLTRGKRAAPKGQCFISLDDVLEFSEGQMFIALPFSPPVGEGKKLASEAFTTLLTRLKQAAPGRVWCAAQFLYHGNDRERLQALARLAAAHKIPLIATNDVHYHVPERRPLQDVVSCIREKCKITDAGFRLAASAERHLKSPDEMARLFADYPEALTAAMDIVSRVDFNLDELSYNYPNEPVPPGKTPQQHLTDLAWMGARYYYPKGIPDKVKVLLLKELALIEELNYAPYFLTVHDIVAYANGKGILCQGRGSAANSAVCYCLGVTAVDPATTELLFERFLSRARKEPPDIDVDFEHERREEVIQYIYERYGRHRASLTATVITYRPRSAVREVGKAMGLSEDVTSALASTVWGSWGSELPETQVKEAGLDLSDPHLRMAVELTQQLIGFPRHLSQHVGGFVLTEDALEEMIPIGNAAMDDRTFIEWDKDDIDELKILKVDVLALGMLTCISKCFSFIEEHYGQRFTLDSMPKGDEVVYQMLQRADAIGVFQVESRAQLNMLPRLKPTKFYDLVIEVAIVRPGPIQGDMVHPYLRRRDGIEKVFYPSPAPEHGPPDELKKVLGRTLGVPLFQEQAMQIAIDAAKFTPDEANDLRRAMATFRRMGTIHTLEHKMVSRMIMRGYDPDFAQRCFNQIKGFGEYGFPESHAASFALLVYASAWLKCHYPEVFCTGLLNAQPMGFYAPAQIVRDAREHSVEVRPIDINWSHWDNTLELCDDDKTRAVRLGFRQVDGLRKEAMEEFVRMREGREAMQSPCSVSYLPLEGRLKAAQSASVGVKSGEIGLLLLGVREENPKSSMNATPQNPRPKYAPAISTSPQGGGETNQRIPLASLEDIRHHTSLTLANLERLAAADAFRSIGLDRRQGLWAVRGLVSDAQLPLFSEAEVSPAGPDIKVQLPKMRLSEHVVADYQTHRLSLKAHPVSFLRPAYDQRRITRCADLETLKNNQRVDVAGVVLIRQKPGTAKGVVFMTIEDESGVANIIVWNKVMQRYRKVVMGSRLVLIKGMVQRTKEVIHVIARELVDITGDLDLLSDEQMPAPLAHADEVANPVTERPGPPTRSSNRSGHSGKQPQQNDLNRIIKRPEPTLDPTQVDLFQHHPANENSGAFLRRKKRNHAPGIPRPRDMVTPAQPVPKQEIDKRRGETTPSRGRHPRNVRIIPKSRDFH